ncbi:MAG TPA: BRCT domain-containing protein [Longimicrobiales bacterium]|nr:BRCT domain-containing protein [Longimicrobiales bacterium]
MSPATRARARHAQRRIEQGLAEMFGLVRGIAADGRVSADEATRLSEWARANPEVASRWPANVLARRLERIFADGRLEARERTRLSAMLSQLAENPVGVAQGFPLATDLPVTHPEPEVTFEGKTFVFAGEMAYGPTHQCEREVIELGGTCERGINRRTDYLVIGSQAADDWAQSDFGSLVDEVVQYRSRGMSVAVITEEHWTAALP